MEPSDSHDEDGISTIPFVDQPAFGRGLWRHPISFVSASTDTPDVKAPAPPATSIADQYLAIVFPNGPPAIELKYELCPSCKEPMKESSSREHYLTLAHQLSLPRTPTPSAIDRSRMGLKYMERHGFDIDARKGLGVAGEGRLYPVRAREKRDKLGVGVDQKDVVMPKEKPKETLFDAGKIRKKAVEDKAKAEKLRKLFYEDDKVSEYLSELQGQEQIMSASKLRLGCFKSKGKSEKRRK